uniref:Capsid protein n=1 Tax=viral metagenome TaxID=1070528 RepID=A0A6M3XRJ0_9ZZZZ
MAVDLAAFVQDMTHAFYEEVRNVSAAGWQRLTAAASSPGMDYKEARAWGIAPMTAQSTSAKSSWAMGSGSATTSPLSYDGNDTFTYKLIRDNPGLVMSRVRAQAANAMLGISSAFWAVVAACESTAHPLSTTSIIGNQGGGASSACFMVDAFTFYPLNSVSNFNQANLYGLSFSADAITTMLAARSEYLDRSGNPFNTGLNDELPFVIVPAEYRQLAEDIRAQRGLIYDGAGLQSGSFQERTSGVVVPPGVASNSNWGLWYRERLVDEMGRAQYFGPVYPVINKTPTVEIAKIPGYAGVMIDVEVEFAIHTSLHVDLGLQWSSP